jgi:hypothetical protein
MPAVSAGSELLVHARDPVMTATYIRRRASLVKSASSTFPLLPLPLRATQRGRPKRAHQVKSRCIVRAHNPGAHANAHAKNCTA